MVQRDQRFTHRVNDAFGIFPGSIFQDFYALQVQAGFFKSFFHFQPLRNITEYQDRADDISLTGTDRRATVGNGALAAIARDQDDVADHVLCRTFRHGCFDRNNGALACFIVNDTKNIFHRTPHSLGLRPAGEFFSKWIEQCHPPVNIRGHHRVANGLECNRKPLLTDLQGGIDLLKLIVDDLLFRQQIPCCHGN